jgi:hypothetical protein
MYEEDIVSVSAFQVSGFQHFKFSAFGPSTSTLNLLSDPAFSISAFQFPVTIGHQQTPTVINGHHKTPLPLHFTLHQIALILKGSALWH